MQTRKLDPWDVRLLRGFAVAGVSEEARGELVAALGALGCEAEFGLALLRTPATLRRPLPRQGEQWLRQVQRLSRRLVTQSEAFQLAAQGYLAALAASTAAPERPTMPVAVTRDAWGQRFDATPGVWWPERGAVALQAEPAEYWLRRAGFPLRHSVSVGLPEHLETLENTLALLLHALHTLPPSGVVSREALAISLITLATDLQGDLVPHHLLDMDPRHIGLVTACATLLRLRAPDATDLTSDIAWAQGELNRARAHLAVSATGSVTRPLTRPTNKLWAREVVADWERTLARLEALRAEQHAAAGLALATPKA